MSRPHHTVPILPVRHMDRAIEHYRKLGFEVRRYEGAESYAFADWNGALLHLNEAPDLDVTTNTSVVYLYVDDAVAVHKAWAKAAVDGVLYPPSDKPWGMHEGVHIDPDYNLIRFGHSID